MVKSLSLQDMLVDGAKIGFTHTLNILGTLILYLLTFWIPYINIGTTIAVFALPLKLASKEGFSPTYIFDPVYRKKFGDSLLLLGLQAVAILLSGLLGIYSFMVIMPILMGILGQAFASGGGMMMGGYGMRGGMEFDAMSQFAMMSGIFFPIMLAIMLTPVIVLQSSWVLSFLYLIDKGMAPLEAIQKSTASMEGQKGFFFLADIIISLGMILLMLVLTYLLGLVITSLGVYVVLNAIITIILFFVLIVYKAGIVSTVYQARKSA